MIIIATKPISNKNCYKSTERMSKTAKDMTSVYEFILKKPHWEGEGNAACCLNIPKRFAQQMEIDRQSYLKVTYRQDEQKLVVEKLIEAEGGHIDIK